MDDPLIRSTDERLARLAARRTDRPASSTPHDRTPPGRRRHPAGGARRSALALSVTTTLGLAAHLHHADAGSASASEVDVAPISGSTATVATAGASTTSAAGAVDTTPTVAATAAVETATVETTPAVETTAAVEITSASLADGTFTGDTFTNEWGPVQVAITVTDGSITSVDVLQYPADDRKSVRINQQALPTLIEDTLTAQSAEVDTVSGATYTSEGYRQSLQSAIDDARAAVVAP